MYVHRSFAALAAGLLVVLSAGAACAAEAREATAFLKRLYAHYPTPENAQAYDWSGDGASTWFDQGLVAAIHEDQVLADGEVGALDIDPICQCQDDAGLKATVGPATLVDPRTARAVVILHFTEEKPPLTIQVNYTLVRTSKGWRIHDLSAPDMPSLLHFLEKANAEARRAKKQG
jgi:hypothetical protein